MTGSSRDRTSNGPVAGRLAGKIAVVTGAGGGQGQAAAILFAQAGAIVVASDLNQAGVEATTRIARERGLQIYMSAVDAADEASVGPWIDDAAKAHGGLDILYNNAANTHFAPFGEMTLHQWRETMRLELDIVFIPSRAIWRHLVARGGGAIINIASVSGMRATEFIGAAAHATGKSGVIGFTRQLALEGAPHWIRANSISPGPIVAPPTEAMLAQSEEFAKNFNGWPMMSRTGRPLDIAYAGLFLASDEASFITGANLAVDGGWSTKGGYTAH
ncbi:SDR family oxidoreductase [Sphingobium phenoxybenzoativorans]|uniref:SDR family oxidoreductase n=1 Tax=Sphingobium phenoxybenzoativorans TaxID=1592790 RepID=A0A975KAI7_9SPHN|nr:SDR family NAD(P)-dependent oxidoreductase [Sphingobium phenoxybenzoativorans]QUT07821.1 SDR family oxidoreductase [Sphingobium phenoxybenzoativorans]